MRSFWPKPARRIRAREAEQLLSGQPGAPDRRGLVRLLAAAAAPARPGELAGERAAVEAFRRAYRHPVERPRRRLGAALRRTVVVKVCVGAAVLFLGGTALAAGTGELPAPAQQSAHDLLSPLGVPAPRHQPGGSDADRASGGGAKSAPPTPARPGPDSAPSGAASPAADLAELCRAYIAAQAKHEAPDARIREPLAAAAGDPHKIPVFCARILHTSPPPAGDNHSDGGAAHPSTKGSSGPP
jgi:hypothetical protein